jgi:hypothetical protein
MYHSSSPQPLSTSSFTGYICPDSLARFTILLFLPLHSVFNGYGSTLCAFNKIPQAIGTPRLQRWPPCTAIACSILQQFPRSPMIKVFSRKKSPIFHPCPMATTARRDVLAALSDFDSQMHEWPLRSRGWVDIIPHPFRHTPLYWARRNGHQAVLKLLQSRYASERN